MEFLALPNNRYFWIAALTFVMASCTNTKEDYHAERIKNITNISEISKVVSASSEVQLIYMQTSSCNSCNLEVLSILDSLKLNLNNAFIILEKENNNLQSLNVKSKWSNNNRQIEVEISELKKCGIMFGKHFVANFKDGELIDYKLF